MVKLKNVLFPVESAVADRLKKKKPEDQPQQQPEDQQNQQPAVRVEVVNKSGNQDNNQGGYPTASLPVTPGTKVDSVKIDGKEFAIPKREVRQLQSTGQITPDQISQPTLEGSPQLAQRQQSELQAIDTLINSRPQENVTTRNIRAGLSAADAISSTFGLADKGQLTQDQINALPSWQKGLLTAFGKVFTTGIGPVKLARLFDQSGNIQVNQQDAASNLKEATRISRAATSRGANVQQAISSLNLLEASTRQKYNDAQYSLRNSPAEVADGVNLADDMAANLRIIVELRQALERYQLTGDPNEVINMTGFLE